MKGSDQFKTAIRTHLENLAASDALFAEVFKKENKNIDDCCSYILSTVQASSQNGFADEEIFGMAVHYYQEVNIKVGKPQGGRVVVNHHIDAPAKPSGTVTSSAATSKSQAKATPKKADKKQDPNVQPSFF